MKKSATSKMLNNLEDKGYINRLIEKKCSLQTRIRQLRIRVCKLQYTILSDMDSPFMN